MEANPYESMADRYEHWFIKNDKLFFSELKAIKQVMPTFQKGIEIGVGTGLFASALGIQEGVEPASAMRNKARQRGINVKNASAEHLPLPTASYDLALMVTVDCYLTEPRRAYREIRRILIDNGHLIVASLDRSSPLGAEYEVKRRNDPFYASARLRSAAETIGELTQAGFTVLQTWQTIFSLENKEQPILPGFGNGLFVVFLAGKAVV